MHPFELLKMHCLLNVNKSQNQNVFSTFSEPLKTLTASVSPLGSFYGFLRSGMTVFPSLSYTSTSEIPTL